jgi:DNA-directed RNA polymerase specialized sigma24 family protein
MFGANKTRKQQTSPYATRGDFCRVFEKDMNRLHLLSFLLTGDATMAEQCFVGGLHIAQEGTQVFKEWAESWARRTIILNAIRMIRPRLGSDHRPPALDRSLARTATEPAELAGIVELPALERFAFVMSVLERYTDQECSLLLSCRRGDVAAARTRALQHMGDFAELQSKVVSIDWEQTMRDDLGTKLQPEAFSALATSA